MPTRPGYTERRLRRTEGLLLLGVALLIVCGALLLVFAKQRSAAVPLPGASAAAAEATIPVNINTATARQIADALGISPEAAQAVVAARERGGGFGDVDALGRGRQKLVPPDRLAVAASHLSVRTWEAARNRFLLACAGLLLFLFAGHIVTRRLQPRADPVLLPIAGALSALGVFVLFALKDPVRDMPAFWAQALGIVAGGTIALAIGLSPRIQALPLHRYGYIYALAAVISTLVLGVLGAGPGGVHLSVGGIQPVEFVKILLVFFLAAYLADRGPLLNEPLRRAGPIPLPRPSDTAPLLVLYALPLALFALVKDLGPVLLLFGTFLLLVYLATGRGVYVLLGIGMLALGGWVGYLLHFGVFRTRVDMWLSPWANMHKSGDHLALGLWGLASGGPLGSGLGLGGTHYIPRGGSDLVFAALGEETGLPGTLLICLAFLVIAARGIGIARRTSSDFDRYLAAGLSGLLAIQAFVILSGTLGLLPLTGITLPFVSYGKSSLIASFLIVGLLLSLSNRAAQAGGGGVTPPPAPPTFRVASARIGALFVALLGIGIPLRLLWVQGFGSSQIATRRVRVPDADNVPRQHINPRLLFVASHTRRGRLLDRAGRVLAATQNGHRVYPYGAATGHLVGYVDPSVGGPTGFEAQFASQLQGYTSITDLLPLWRRKDSPGFAYPQGTDVVTALDAELQKAAFAALLDGASHVRDRRTGTPQHRGAAVVLDARTGEVLAAVTAPSYDPAKLTPTLMRRLSADVEGEYPLVNRAVDGRYPPGSTFKIAVASALFANDRADFTYVCHHIDENVIWSANGHTYARRRIVDDEGDQPHGLTNLTEAITQSCNIYFAHAAIALGPAALRSGVEKFGFAKLPTASQFGSELPDIGYGQGPMLASPMEMAGVAQTVANGGARLKPQYLKGAAPETAATPLNASDAARLAEMMRRVTVSGTAAGRFDALPYPVAGKTGTAQNDRYDKAPHSWFIGFAPADHPKIAFAVLVENGGYGAQVAAPVAERILEAARLTR